MRQELRRAALVLSLIAAAVAVVVPAARAATRGVPPPSDPVYAKECGSCHTAFSPELLPARSWQKVMATLGDHFGESAQVEPTVAARITEYLTHHAADDATNEQSVGIMHSLRPGDAPTRITEVPYIAGLHAAALDPVRGGNPRPRTLAECSACHVNVARGSYIDRRYSVTDEAFRSGR